ncbi:DUF1641 domain-containing protein [Hydrogenibacillus schlegelii]|uniref:DUF1641 domain-containing protein n=1 Tax=Hydrogenibacillus schlegelii TaxID=1484 RepID=A0A179IM37_HYDSH|nr:DUF1641 domain-containing protein [Hydrogenibacillus schlegelii]OAR03425.1 hypothetical protein SA87_01465 [Hydrogenibacillus schlegelii]
MRRRPTRRPAELQTLSSPSGGAGAPMPSSGEAAAGAPKEQRTGDPAAAGRPERAPAAPDEGREGLDVQAGRKAFDDRESQKTLDDREARETFDSRIEAEPVAMDGRGPWGVLDAAERAALVSALRRLARLERSGTLAAFGELLDAAFVLKSALTPLDAGEQARRLVRLVEFLDDAQQRGLGAAGRRALEAVDAAEAELEHVTEDGRAPGLFSLLRLARDPAVREGMFFALAFLKHFRELGLPPDRFALASDADDGDADRR